MLNDLITDWTTLSEIDMSTAAFEIRYDGEELAEHTMDVHYLAPALLAIGELIREANAQFNGDRSKARVLVKSDAEHKCFSVNFDVVVSWYDQVAAFIKHEEVKSAKEVLEWIGITVTSTIGSGVSLFTVLKWIGRKKTAGLTISNSTIHGNVIYNAGDGSSITVNPQIAALAENPQVRQAAEMVAAPLLTSGIDSLEFRADNDNRNVVRFETPDANDLANATDAEGLERNVIIHEPQTITAHLRVLSPIFDPAATHWRFLHGSDAIRADITDTTIASDAVKRGGVMVDDMYRVKLQIIEHQTPSRQIRKTYKVLEVQDFIPASAPPHQPDLFR